VPRLGTSYVLPSANVHTQVTSTGTADVKTITLEPGSSAMLVDAKTNAGFLTFNGSTPSATNGLPIVNGAQPVLIPLGWYAHSGHQVKWASSVAGNSVLDLLQIV
jgi:hypothetical protein